MPRTWMEAGKKQKDVIEIRYDIHDILQLDKKHFSYLFNSVDDEGVKNCNGKEQHPDHEAIKCKQSKQKAN